MFFVFTPKIGEDEPNLTCVYVSKVSKGLVKNHQLVFEFGKFLQKPGLLVMLSF